MGIKDVFENTGGALKGFFGGVSGKPDLISLLTDISSILDPHEMDVVVMRGAGCEVVFANSSAQAHMRTNHGYTTKCKTGYSKHFPGLCDHCPYAGLGKATEQEPIVVVDVDGRTFTGRRNMISWVDGKPAAIFMLRDVTQEIATKERLYTLAYIDQLTHVPNRLKLKDDFSAMEEGIANGSLTGVVALFDLDHFKAVNDTYGHNTGDIVLRRLTEHLQGERAFSGRLYRLGGDEFVLLFSNPVGKFATDQEMVEHYNEVLSAALQSYTLPNIELTCTLSIGVSVFPKHGANLSEILRKADIALYQAKEAGRNRVSFFSDHFDTAQKFKDMYIGIQPLLQTDGKTYGYELVDRGVGGKEDSKTVTLNEFNRTLDALGLNDIESNLHYFISFSKQLLSPAVLKNLPKEKFIVQINFPAEATKDELLKALQTYQELRSNGYKLALVGMKHDSPMLELLSLADYCKSKVSNGNAQNWKKVIENNPKVRFIATGVDSVADYNRSKIAGFHLFQGFYFNNPPAPKKTKEINPLKVNYFRLLKLSATDGYLDFREISNVISSDVALSYKLLRILNSAAVGLRNISSVATAVAYMGEESLKKWIAVLALSGIADDKPLELVRLSLIRARFGELLTPFFRIKRNPQQVFMVGMLSLLYIALEKTQEQLLDEIPVADEIRQSLLTKTGIYSDLLKFYENYEYANWDAVSQFVEEQNLNAANVNDAYISSVKWYNDLIN